MIFRQLLNDDVARVHLINRIHSGECHCPLCKKTVDAKKRFNAGQKVKCGNCGKWFSWTTDTYLVGVKLSPAVIVALEELVITGLSDEQICRLLSLSPETMRLWRVRIQEAI